MVQHPTLAAPFLDEEAIVDCNAATGFDYAFENYNESTFSAWPLVKAKDGGLINLSIADRAYSSVFPFVVDPGDEWGWITAYSPKDKLLLGYVWKRKDYPWIAHWLHFEGEKIKFRGLEFGTTGIHQPIQAIWEQGLLNLLGQPTCRFIETAHKEQRNYTCFLHSVPDDFKGVEKIDVKDKAITITEKDLKGKRDVFHHLPINHEF